MKLLPIILLALAAAACGDSIGDSCSSSLDCSQDGSRFCDVKSPGGYCTIEGCDFGTCPDEATCVRFYPGLIGAATCEQGDSLACGLDEICTVQGMCAPRSIERRFCMVTCATDGDCRDEYECRSRDVMAVHGGEPVPDPDEAMSLPDQGFCAPRQPCIQTEECGDGYTCDADLLCHKL